MEKDVPDILKNNGITDLEGVLPDYYTKKHIVFGCGNILLGDDGFGPKTIEYYKEHFDVPDEAVLIDVGTSIRNILFNLILAEKRPENIVIIDAVDKDRIPGEVFEIDIDDMPIAKLHDFSVHQTPTLNMLKELRDLCGVNVCVLACQVERIPEEISPGLTETLEKAIPVMCERIKEKLDGF